MTIVQTVDENLRVSRRGQTREAILLAARELVAQFGPSATTVRDITERSRANVAAVNYYFQSKDNLVELAVSDILREVNAAREAALAQAVAEAQDEPLSSEAILCALIAPILTVARAQDGGSLYVRCVFHMRTAPNVAENIRQYNAFSDTAGAFFVQMARSFPELSPRDLVQHYEFARGTALHMIMNLDPQSRRYDRLMSRALDTALPLDATALDEGIIKVLLQLLLPSFGKIKI